MAHQFGEELSTGNGGNGWAFLLALALASWALTLEVSADVLYIPLNGLQLATQNSSKTACGRNLFQIMQATHVWSMDNENHAPPSLEALAYIPASPAVFFCPANNAVSVPTNWADVNWGTIDYQWNTNVDWNDPIGIACTCKIHDSAGRVDGSYTVGDFRPGWPFITAGPKNVYATPGEDVRFEFRVMTNALPPISLQWRREHLYYETNVVRFENPDDPQGIYWSTNVVPKFSVTNLPLPAENLLVLHNVQTNDTDFYSIAVSNEMGVSVSRARLTVGPAYAGCTTNADWAGIYCLNNLRMISLVRASWAAAHNDQQPTSFQVLTNGDGSLMFGWPDALYCRSDKERVAPSDWSGVDFQNLSYQIEWTDTGNAYGVFCRCRVHEWYIETSGEVVQQPQFKSIQRASDGKLQISYKVFAGRTNLLEGATDLVNWTTLASHSQTNGEFQFSDPDVAARRFYRLRLP